MHERKIDIIKHDDFIELVRSLVQQNKIQVPSEQLEQNLDYTALPQDISEILKKAQMSPLKPDILVLSQLLEVLRFGWNFIY